MIGTAGCTDCEHYRKGDRWHPCALIVMKGYKGQHIPTFAVIMRCYLYKERTPIPQIPPGGGSP